MINGARLVPFWVLTLGVDVRVLIQTNRPTPHRTPILDGLAANLGVDLLVMYRWGGSGGRGWGEVPVNHDAKGGWDGAWQALSAARREAASGSWDLVLSLGHAGPLAVGLAVGARSSRTPLALRADANVLRHLESSALRRARRHTISRGLFPPGRSSVLSIGRLNECYWRGLGYRRIRELPYEVICPPGEAPLPAKVESQVSSALQSESPKSIGLFVGRLAPVKGLDLLAQALVALPEVNLEVLAVGAGPLESRLRGAPGFTVLGPVPYASLGTVMRRCDFLVLPSRDEPWGLVVNEALAHGLPVLGSDVAGAVHEYRDLLQVSTFRSGSVQALTDALERMPEAAHAPGARVARTVNARAYLERYREALAWAASI